MFIYGHVGQPSHRAVYLTYMQKCRKKKTEAPKPDMKTPKKPVGGKKHGERVPPTKAVHK